MRSDANPVATPDLEYWVRRLADTRALMDRYRDMTLRADLEHIDTFYRIAAAELRRRNATTEGTTNG